MHIVDWDTQSFPDVKIKKLCKLARKMSQCMFLPISLFSRIAFTLPWTHTTKLCRPLSDLSPAFVLSSLWQVWGYFTRFKLENLQNPSAFDLWAKFKFLQRLKNYLNGSPFQLYLISLLNINTLPLFLDDSVIGLLTSYACRWAFAQKTSRPWDLRRNWLWCTGP